MSTTTADIISQLREEKDFIRKAKLIEILYKDKCIRLTEIAHQLGKDPSYISHLLRLLKLPALIVDGYYAKQISLAHLLLLSRLESEDEMISGYETVLAKGMTSQQTESLIREKKFQLVSTPEQLSPELIDAFCTSFQKKHPEMHVSIRQTRISGRLLVEMRGDSKTTTYILNELMRILDSYNSRDQEQFPSELMVLD